MRKSVRNYFFDLDGTLVDSAPGIALSVRAALAALRFPPPREEVRGLIGPPIRSILSRLAGPLDPAQLDALERAFRDSYDSAGWRQAGCYEGVPQMLRSLREAGKSLFLVTNKPIRAATRILEMQGIRTCFTEVLARDSAPGFASKTAMLRHLLEQWRLRPEESVMIGDTEEDCEAGAAAGMRAMAVTHGYGRLAQHHPFPVLQSLAALGTDPISTEGTI